MRVTKYSKPYGVRFTKRVESELIKYRVNHPELNRSDVIQNAVECFLFNKKCLAKRRLLRTKEVQ